LRPQEKPGLSLNAGYRFAYPHLVPPGLAARQSARDRRADALLPDQIRPPPGSGGFLTRT